MGANLGTTLAINCDTDRACGVSPSTPPKNFKKPEELTEYIAVSKQKPQRQTNLTRLSIFVVQEDGVAVTKEEMDQLRVEFKAMDEDDSGFLDRQEVRQRMFKQAKKRCEERSAQTTDQALATMVDEKTKRFMAKYDANRDGYVLFEGLRLPCSVTGFKTLLDSLFDDLLFRCLWQSTCAWLMISRCE